MSHIFDRFYCPPGVPPPASGVYGAGCYATGISPENKLNCNPIHRAPWFTGTDSSPPRGPVNRGFTVYHWLYYFSQVPEARVRQWSYPSRVWKKQNDNFVYKRYQIRIIWWCQSPAKFNRAFIDNQRQGDKPHDNTQLIKTPWRSNEWMPNTCYVPRLK